MITVTITVKSVADLQEILKFDTAGGGPVSIKPLGVLPIDGRIKVGNRRGKAWSTVEMDYIAGHYQKLTAKAMGKTLGRSAGAVGQLISIMYKKGLPRKNKKNGVILES